MIILSRGSLTQTGRFAPETFALNLSERGSTATITYGIGKVSLTVGDWLQDDTDPGDGIVWRVKTIDTQFNTNTVTVQLEDLINSLNDQLLNGEVKPADITGDTGATTCTARQAIEYILDKQGAWELDDFDYESVSNPYNFNGDSLKAAIETVSASLTDPVWSYDFSAYPFKLSITQLSDGIDSEMRMSRNISTLKVSVDRSRMYTRFYPIGKNNLRPDAPQYYEKNVSTYGLVEKTETDETQDTKEKLAAWAEERLNAHAEPIVTVTVSGLDLSEATGEDLDRFTIGKKCRVPLPAFGTTITEKVTKLSWRDKLADPESVTVTLANQKEDVASIVNRINSSGGRSGRAKAKDDEEDHAWFVDTTDHVSMVAEAVAGKDGEGKPNWSRVAELTVDGNGIDARVTEAEGDIAEAVSAIAMTSTNIAISVANAKSEMYSAIEVTASAITLSVAESSSTVYSVIETTATSIRSEVVRRTRVFVQVTDPALDAGNNIREGDIWVKSIKMKTWNDMSSKTWTSSAEFDWNQYSGSPQYVWDGSKWELLGDQGADVEYGTRIEQTERNISLIARALGAVDPSAIAEIDISSELIQSAVSTAKSELYSIIRQTSTNIMSEVSNNINGVSSVIEQTASSLTSAIARKNKVFVQLTDPVNDYTVIEGDIWIKSTGNDNIKPTWSELSAKTWTSQGSTNWREYYEGYWYVRKNGAWERMNANADVVEIGTQLSQDEKQISLIARDVDANHQEMGARLTVTAQAIRGDVYAAKSSLYSVVMQTATSVFSGVYDKVGNNFSTITQTSSGITTAVNAAKSTLYSTIVQTATSVYSGVYNKVGENFSTITQTSSAITTAVSSAKSTLYSTIVQTSTSIYSTVKDYADGTFSTFRQTSNAIETSVNAAKSTLYTTIMQTATFVSSSVIDYADGKFSTITQTSESITASVSAAKSDLYSVIIQTATGVFSGVYDKVGDNFSTITQTSTSIATSVNAAKSTMYSTIMQTATSVFSGVYDKVGDNFSTITQTASGIKTAVNAAKSTLYTTIMQTATSVFSGVYSKVGDNFSTITQTSDSINASVSSAKSALYSAINTTSTQISLKVGKDEVVSCINQTAETIKIQAGKINLSGYVTASSLNTVDAKIDNLTSGNTTASYLRASRMYCNSLYVIQSGISHQAIFKAITIDGVTYHLLGYGGG